jgi:hypothetical protein
VGAIVILGDARDPDLLRRARLVQARHLIAVCGDSTNAEVAMRAGALVAGTDGRVLDCRVHIVDPALCELLMTNEIARSRSGRFRLEYFNIFESGARALLAEYPPFDRLGASRPGRVEVVGLGDLGRRVVLQTARDWKVIGSEEPLQITMIDPEVARITEELSARYPQLEKICQLEPVELESGRVERGPFVEPPGVPPAAVYVCLAVESDALAAGLSLAPRLRSTGVPVVVCLNHLSGLGSLLGPDRSPTFGNLYAFGLLDQTCDYDLLFAGVYESIARAQHAEYVRAEREKGNTPAINPSMVPWHQLPEVLKESNRDQAAHIGAKLAAVSCEIVPLVDWDEPLFEFGAGELEILARLEHERWVAERRRMGWQSGPDKDVERKLTPYLVPWEQLPEEIREHDRLVVRGLPGFLARSGYQIVRGDGRPGG